MIIVTVLLIANTMRVAAFSRRRETGIMRLVGASGFYIQVPFLLEAALGAAIGGILAGVAMLGIKHFFIDGYLSANIKSISFISWDPVLQIIPILMILGVVLAAVTAMVTLRKYLRV
jgi:cell division transport system permease protein